MTLHLLGAIAQFSAAIAQENSWPELPVPAAGSGGDGSRDAAVVIAIEDYFVAPDLPAARDNGMAWLDWLGTARKVQVVKPIFDSYATREQILADVAAVSKQVRSGGRMWVIFIGHGAPSKDGRDGLLEGVDVQQNALSLESRGVRRSELIRAMEANMPANATAVVVIDACFSGQTASGDLAPKLAPLRDVTFAPSERVTVLTAAANNEYSGPLSDDSRPAFSYLLLGAMRGWGDDGDGKVLASEAIRYASRALLTTVMGRQQTPSFDGPDLTLSPATRREGPNLSKLAAGTGLGSERSASSARRATAESDRPVATPTNERHVPSTSRSKSEPVVEPAVEVEDEAEVEATAEVSAASTGSWSARHLDGGARSSTTKKVGYLQGKQHLEGGFELGLPIAGRLGWHLEGDVVRSFGARCLMTAAAGGSESMILGPSAYVDFRMADVWDLEVSVGGTWFYGGYVGVAAQYDPYTFFQLNLGGIVAFGNGFAVGPDITAGFVW